MSEIRCSLLYKIGPRFTLRNVSDQTLQDTRYVLRYSCLICCHFQRKDCVESKLTFFYNFCLQKPLRGSVLVIPDHSNIVGYFHYNIFWFISIIGKRRYNIKLWKTFTDCFNCLPVAAILDEKIFCCHGGTCLVLSAVLSTRSQLVDILLFREVSL